MGSCYIAQGLSLVLHDDLEYWDVGVKGRSEIQEKWDIYIYIYIYIYIHIADCCTETLTQQCKAAVLQIKKKVHVG